MLCSGDEYYVLNEEHNLKNKKKHEMYLYYVYENSQMKPIGVFDVGNLNESDYYAYNLNANIIIMTEEERKNISKVYVTYAYSILASNPLNVYFSKEEVESSGDSFWELELNKIYIQPFENNTTFSAYFFIDYTGDGDPADALNGILNGLMSKGFADDGYRHMGPNFDEYVKPDYNFGNGGGSLLLGWTCTFSDSPYSIELLIDEVHSLASDYSFDLTYKSESTCSLLNVEYSYYGKSNDEYISITCFAKNEKEIEQTISQLIFDYQDYFDEDEFVSVLRNDLQKIEFENDEMRKEAIVMLETYK